MSEEKDTAFVPFYFSTETMGNTFGVAGVAKGVWQPQAALFGMHFILIKTAMLVFYLLSTLHFLRMFCSALRCTKHASTDNPYYIGSQGDNDSSIDDKTIADGLEQNYQFEFKYLSYLGAMLQNMAC